MKKPADPAVPPGAEALSKRHCLRHYDPVIVSQVRS